MKLSLCALLLVVAPLPALAQRKGMGPSAIEAARLKKYPPPNYLSHYLPDDRYKIAGKVWKYVSTDLDTYYHIPSSPNMLRQPASRVIGFASAKDAEEAGYVADPTDGTANNVSSAAPSSSPKSNLTLDEARYLLLVSTIVEPVFNNFDRVLDNIEIARKQASLPAGLSSYRPVAARNLRSSRTALAQLKSLIPPTSLRKSHNYFVAALKEMTNSATSFDLAIRNNQPAYMVGFSDSFKRFGVLLEKGYKESGVDSKFKIRFPS